VVLRKWVIGGRELGDLFLVKSGQLAMTENTINQDDSDSTANLFHDIATPLIISKMKAELLSAYLPQLITTLASSPDTAHLLPDDEKVIEALLKAPEIMVSNLGLVQKKVNLLSASLLHQVTNFGTSTVAAGSLSAMALEKTESQATVLERTSAIKKILLVDDELIHRDIANALLSPHFEMDYAKNGIEAIHHCENNSYDLILMDLHMPKMNGEQATIALRALIGDETMIIGLTSLPIGANRSGLLAIGFTDFLEKPLKLHSLQALLRDHALTS
jgi:CheY-like chemotaxis protein